MEKLQPEKLLEILKERGIEVSIEQATGMHEFMRNLAHLVVSHYLNSKKTAMKCLRGESDGSVHPDPDSDDEHAMKKKILTDEMEIKWILI